MLEKDDTAVSVIKIDDKYIESDDKFMVSDGEMVSDGAIVLISVNVDIEKVKEAEIVLLIIAVVDD